MHHQEIEQWREDLSTENGYGFAGDIVGEDLDLGLVVYVVQEEYPEDFREFTKPFGAIEGPVRARKISEEMECCERCYGSGEIWEPEPDAFKDCPSCEGTGNGLRTRGGLLNYHLKRELCGVFAVEVMDYGTYGSKINRCDIDRATHMVEIAVGYEKEWPGYSAEELATEFIEETAYIWAGDIHRVVIEDARGLVSETLGGIFGEEGAIQEAEMIYKAAREDLQQKITDLKIKELTGAGA